MVGCLDHVLRGAFALREGAPIEIRVSITVDCQTRDGESGINRRYQDYDFSQIYHFKPRLWDTRLVTHNRAPCRGSPGCPPRAVLAPFPEGSILTTLIAC